MDLPNKEGIKFLTEIDSTNANEKLKDTANVSHACSVGMSIIIPEWCQKICIYVF